jgi:hypothetical protein
MAPVDKIINGDAHFLIFDRPTLITVEDFCALSQQRLKGYVYLYHEYEGGKFCHAK